MRLRNLTRVLCVEWHTIYPWSLGKDSVILDLGANLGRFSKKMFNCFGCSCHAVEASPQLFKLLESTEKILNYHYAITDDNEPVEFYFSNNILGSSILPPTQKDATQTSDRVQGITLERFVEQHKIERLDLVKMDIEGAEIKVFDSLPDEFLSKIAQLTVEFHDFCKQVPDAEVKRIVNRLQKLGFFYIRMSGVGNQDTLLINRKLVKVSQLELWYIKYIVRNILGVMRVVLRFFRIQPDNYPYYI